MKLSDRQLMMLREMGIRLWPAEGMAQGLAAEEASVATVEEERPRPGSIGSHIDTAMAGLMARPKAPVAVAPPAGGSIEGEGEGEGDGHGVAIDGTFQADWMFVGEPAEPGGLPSGDRASQLLDNMLLACGLDRKAAANQPGKQVFVTHAAASRSPNGQPSAEESSADEQRLMRQIEAVQPKVVVAMGRIAAMSLLRSAEPLGKLRGRVHQASGAPGRAVVVTYPPAYLLRNPQDKARAWEDLCLAMSVVKAHAG